MRSIKYLFTLLFSLFVGMGTVSCVAQTITTTTTTTTTTTIVENDDIYDNHPVNVDYEMVISYGTPTYYNGHVSYYLYRNIYYYPYIWQGLYYLKPYRRCMGVQYQFVPTRFSIHYQHLRRPDYFNHRHITPVPPHPGHHADRHHRNYHQPAPPVHRQQNFRDTHVNRNTIGTNRNSGTVNRRPSNNRSNNVRPTNPQHRSGSSARGSSRGSSRR